MTQFLKEQLVQMFQTRSVNEGGKHIHCTSSESSWNSILPFWVWLVSSGSSIPSAALSSTCCCSTEYLWTKNLWGTFKILLGQLKYNESQERKSANSNKLRHVLLQKGFSYRFNNLGRKTLTCRHRHISWQRQPLLQCWAAWWWWLLSRSVQTWRSDSLSANITAEKNK